MTDTDLITAGGSSDNDALPTAVAGIALTQLYAAALTQSGRANRQVDGEEAFLAGLLHDVGRPVLIQELVNLHAAEKLPVDEAALRTYVRFLVGNGLTARYATFLARRLGLERLSTKLLLDRVWVKVDADSPPWLREEQIEGAPDRQVVLR